MKYKAVFEESFGEIHMNSRRNFHEWSDGNFSGDIQKDSKGEFGGGGIRGDLHGVRIGISRGRY